MSIKLAGQYVYRLFGLTDIQLTNFLKEWQPSQQAMLESLTSQYAFNNGKDRCDLANTGRPNYKRLYVYLSN